MSKTGKFFVCLLVILLTLSLALGVIFLFKKGEDDNKKKLDALAVELNINIENLEKFKKELELNGFELQESKTKIEYLESENKNLKDTIVLHKTTIVELTDSITKKEQEIIEKNNTITEIQERIVYLETESDENQEEIDRLNAQIKTLQDEIKVLQEKVAELTETKANLESIIDKLESELEEKNNKIVELESTIEKLEEENSKITININVLNETIIELQIQIGALKDALNKESDKTYLDELFSCKVTFVDYVNDYYEFAVVSDCVDESLNGSYLMNCYDYSIQKLGDFEFSKIEILDESKLLMYGGDPVVFDYSNNSVVKTLTGWGEKHGFSEDYCSDIIKFESGNYLLLNNLMGGMGYFNVDDLSIVGVYEDDMPTTCNDWFFVNSQKMYFVGQGYRAFKFEESDLSLTYLSDYYWDKFGAHFNPYTDPIGLIKDEPNHIIYFGDSSKNVLCSIDYETDVIENLGFNDKYAKKYLGRGLFVRGYIFKNRYLVQPCKKSFVVYDIVTKQDYDISYDQGQYQTLLFGRPQSGYHYDFDGIYTCDTISETGMFYEVLDNVYYFTEYGYTKYLDLNNFKVLDNLPTATIKVGKTSYLDYSGGGLPVEKEGTTGYTRPLTFEDFNLEVGEVVKFSYVNKYGVSNSEDYHGKISSFYIDGVGSVSITQEKEYHDLAVPTFRCSFVLTEEIIKAFKLTSNSTLELSVNVFWVRDTSW